MARDTLGRKSRKLLVASLGVASVNYVAAGCGTPETSGNLPSPPPNFNSAPASAQTVSATMSGSSASVTTSLGGASSTTGAPTVTTTTGQGVGGGAGEAGRGGEGGAAGATPSSGGEAGR